MVSGARCGSPALKGQIYCHHHYSLRRLLPERFVASDGFVKDDYHGIRFTPMPLLEDAASIQTAYMQIIHGVLNGHMPWPGARIALAAVKAAARNLPWLKTERAAMAGEEAGLAPEVSESRERVWTNEDKTLLRDNVSDPPETEVAQATPAGAAAPAQTPQSGDPSNSATRPIPFRKQPETVAAGVDGQPTTAGSAGSAAVRDDMSE
jgi:hypothetical protein